MNQEKTYDKCGYYTKYKCPHRDEKLMDKLIKKLNLIKELPLMDLDGKKIKELGEKVNKQFCNSCNSFEGKLK
ncbi:MAG: hypothetical protein V3V70_06805 [Candidatus Scalindua sp.]|jgi:hypothetical protein